MAAQPHPGDPALHKCAQLAVAPIGESSMPPSAAEVDPRSGYCAATKTFHSLRAPLPLPPADLPLSFPSFMFSLLPAALPSRPALVDAATGEAVPFPAFLSRVRALAAALRARLGISRGDVAFVLAPPGVHVPVLYYALMAVGAVVSPANPALTAGEISGLVALSGPSVAFAVKATAGKLPPGLNTVLLDSARFLSFFHEARDEDGTAAGTDVVTHQSDPAAILYSSGTTGRAKAVVLTHRNLMTSNATRAAATVDVLMLAVPLFHVYGFTFCLRVAPSANTLVLHTARRFDGREVLAAVGRFGATRLALAPPALLAIVRAAEEEETLIACAATLQAVNCGGAPLAAELFRRFLHKFPGVCLLQGYGLTETTSGFCRAVGEEESAQIGSVGRLSWGAQAKVVHPETGVALPPGVPGELWVRGPFVMKGYAGDEDSTSKILDSEGWLRTGDLCYIDKDGIVFVVDRLKELIKYKGYQVPPAELESLLQTHPDIDEAAVVPYPDDQAGELPVAFIVSRSGSNLHEAQIKEFVAKQVVHYKQIHHVFFVNSIPKNAAGKILRMDLAKLTLQHIRSKL
ncbi:4-coumarate--CoA ligase-like 7 [Panicum miliaceum]|uniref:4-coumarate--CoA ligase n=1 Tax=Panicum miliaceum TaxID=4540 RepID=A0A3L6PGT6_PANMI|nr:4-coumarate--CoA ligase-like 7 [Panicum miliaceum]